MNSFVMRAVIAATLREFCLDELPPSRNRTRNIAQARGCVCYLLREWCGMSWPKIGNAIGVDHTAAMRAYQQVREAESDMNHCWNRRARFDDRLRAATDDAYGRILIGGAKLVE